MKKILSFIVMFYMGLILFMPKINLYYTLENFAKQEHVSVQEGSIKDRWIDLLITDATLFYDGIASAKVASLTFKPWIVYNRISATDIKPAKALEKMLDVKAESVVVTYAIWNYKQVTIEAVGDFGLIHGFMDILTQTVHLVLEPSAKFKNNTLVRQYFKKEKEGLVYESKF